MHVLGHGQLSDLVAEQGEFGLDAPATPRGILPRHASDEGRSSASSFGRPSGFGLDFQRQ